MGKDVWAAGEGYEPYIGRWSRRVARLFLEDLALPEDRDWLDVGCGTGALLQTILERAAPRSVTGIDPSAGFIGYARAHTPSDRAHFALADAQALPLDTGSVDVAVSGLALNFVPDPQRGAAEMARVVRPGGVAAAYVWDYAGTMELMTRFWRAAADLDPQVREMDEGRRFPLCQPQPLAELFRRAGLSRVEVWPIDIRTDFRDFDDYWQPFLGGQGVAPGYVTTLSQEHRAALRERLRAEVPAEADGSISLQARAWAVRGTRHPA